MKNFILASTLLTLTTMGIIFFPFSSAQAWLDSKLPTPTEQPILVIDKAPDDTIKAAQQFPKIEVVFALDTTGSMGGMIQAAKDRIWSIATTLAAADPAPEIKIGLVAYRDRNDDYVTQRVDLNSDLDLVFSELMQLQAQGGGDTPESVNQALYESVNHMSWSQDPDTYQVVFLVGDAPAHTDYLDDTPYAQTVAMAKKKGIIINTLQCGDMHATAQQWQTIASLGAGDYLKVEQNGSAIATTSPFDEELANLARELESTRIFYGDKQTRQRSEAKTRASESLFASADKAALAKRAEYNSTASGALNFLGESELVNDISSGKVKLTEIKENMLPAAIATMAPAEKETFVKEKIEQREKVKKKIKTLTEKRKAYVAKQIAATEDTDSSLDYQLFDTLKKQAKSKGISYEDSDLSL